MSVCHRIIQIICFLFIGSTYQDTGAAWVLARNGEIPPNAVVGGREGDVELYVARFYNKEGHLVPGKLHHKTRRAYTCQGGREDGANVYQVLTHPDQSKLKWIPTTHGVVPTGALQGGKEGGHTLYIGRANHESRLICGKVVIGSLFLPLNGREFCIRDNYEVLCVTSVNCD